MPQIIENANLSRREIKASLQLDKAICTSWYSNAMSGHFSDYLDEGQTLVTLQAAKDSNLLLWDSSLLISHCAYNDPLKVNFHLNSAQNAALINVESLSGNNGFILQKSRDRYDFTYYFSLLHSHALTGELLVSPSFYFMENPNFNLGPGTQASISELLKINPICLNIKKNQILCFDKFHYQMEYNEDFAFIRL